MQSPKHMSYTRWIYQDNDGHFLLVANSFPFIKEPNTAEHAKSKLIRKWVKCYLKCLTISCCLRVQSSRQGKEIIFALLKATNLGLGPS